MLERTITIRGKEGLHARPAAAFVKAAALFKSKVQLEYKGRKVNAKSTIDMMMCAASQGDEIVLRIEGEDEDAAMGKLSALLEGVPEENR